jgi:putative acyl-CoA dehydrogenase
MCLDVLRAFERETEAAHALFASWQETAREHPALAPALDALVRALTDDPATREASARRIAQQLVLTAQAVLLARHAPEAVADAFIETRLGHTCGQTGRVYGTLPGRFDHASQVARVFTA